MATSLEPCRQPARRNKKPNESDFLLGVIEGRPEAVAELFDRYAAMVRGLLVRTLGNAFDVEDLMQETFLAVVRRARTLRDPNALQSFVGSIAIRTARNELRRRTVRRWIGLGESADTPGIHDDPTAREALRHLDAALNRLEAGQRILFVLRHIEQLELTEVASHEGVSLATIKRRLSRAERAFEAVAQADPLLRDYLNQRYRQ